MTHFSCHLQGNVSYDSSQQGLPVLPCSPKLDLGLGLQVPSVGVYLTDISPFQKHVTGLLTRSYVFFSVGGQDNMNEPPDQVKRQRHSL